MRLTTGLPCPTCGMTRASLSLLHLNFGEAFYYHPMVFVVIPALIAGAVLLLIGKATKKRCMPWIIALAASLFIVYIVRMILFFPNTEPMAFNEGSLAGLILHLIRRLR
ncbi:MAG: DUF2752 domain-containing protein [Eubacteriales bacterium]|nr:DUF2752 domain-containing protein [Eubacteriales bacterium]